MDLLERGRSLGELGRSLRWTDVRAFLMNAPADSHTAAALDPEGNRLSRLVHHWASPQGQVLGAVHDSLESTLRTMSGMPIAEHGIVARSIRHLLDTAGEKEPVVKPSAPERRRKSPADIRAQIQKNASR